VGLTTHQRKKVVTKDHKKPRTWTDSLDKRTKRKKMDMGFGTWNVRSMLRADSLRGQWRKKSQDVNFLL
jgi:hypothetical protein